MKSRNSVSTRCSYKTSGGKPCRYSAQPNSPFCKYHNDSRNPDAEAVASDLAAAGDFESPGEVKNVLRQIFLALANGSISERRAGILTYIAQTILHAHRAVALEEKLAAEAAADEEAEREEEECLPLTWNLMDANEIAILGHSNPRLATKILEAKAALSSNRNRFAEAMSQAKSIDPDFVPAKHIADAVGLSIDQGSPSITIAKAPATRQQATASATVSAASSRP